FLLYILFLMFYNFIFILLRLRFRMELHLIFGCFSFRFQSEVFWFFNFKPSFLLFTLHPSHLSFLCCTLAVLFWELHTLFA
ncbi:hypothetical protein DFJ43DRAFT_1078133, partial [Lentinula guzmanii]